MRPTNPKTNNKKFNPITTQKKAIAMEKWRARSLRAKGWGVWFN